MTAATPHWVHGAFFERVEKQLIPHWEDTAMLGYLDPDQKLYGGKTRNATVRVCLSRGGEVLGVTLTQSSGVVELDEASLRVFAAAAPFPNPPDEMVDVDGQIRFPFAFEFYSTVPGRGAVMRFNPPKALP